MMLRLFLVLLLAAPSLAQTAESYRQRAIELSRKKSWDEAIANYQQAIALNPNDASTHYNFALALKYKGDSQQAVQEFQAAPIENRRGQESARHADGKGDDRTGAG